MNGLQCYGFVKTEVVSSSCPYGVASIYGRMWSQGSGYTQPDKCSAMLNLTSRQKEFFK